MVSKTVGVAKRANSISNSIGGVWKSLDDKVKATDNAGSQEIPQSRATPEPAVRSRRAGNRRPPLAAKTCEDPKGIAPGISYDELVRRFGPPSFAVTTEQGSQTFTYLAKEGNVDIEVADDHVLKVAKVSPQEIAIVAPK
jgi:hypothetical protein